MPLDPGIVFSHLQPQAPIDPLEGYKTLQSLRMNQLQQSDVASQIQERQATAQQRQMQNQQALDSAKAISDHIAGGGGMDDPKLLQKLYGISPTIGENFEQHRATVKNLQSESANREATLAEIVRKNKEEAGIKREELVPPQEREYQAWRKAQGLDDNAATRVQYKVQGMKVGPDENVLGGIGPNGQAQPLFTTGPKKPTDDFSSFYLPAYFKSHGMQVPSDWNAASPQQAQMAQQATQAYKQASQDPAMRAILEDNARNSRTDKSYAQADSQVKDIRKPIDSEAGNISQAKTLLSQNNPSANALVAPAIIKAIVGGAGSGVRITTPEINAVNNGRGKIDNFQSWLTSWSLDPSKYQALLQDQKTWLKGVLEKISEKVEAKQGAISKASQDLINANDVTVHRQTVKNLNDTLESIDNGKGASPTASGGWKIISIK